MAKMIKRALYAGSFDPMTRGHLDIVRKAATMFDRVHIGIGQSAKKTRLFSPEEARDLIGKTIMEAAPELAKVVEPGYFSGSLGRYAVERGCTHIVRGLRQVSDFNDEFTLHGVMERNYPTIPMVHIICEAEFLHVSSSTAREIASIEEKMDWLVTPSVEKALREKFASD